MRRSAGGRGSNRYGIVDGRLPSERKAGADVVPCRGYPADEYGCGPASSGGSGDSEGLSDSGEWSQVLSSVASARNRASLEVDASDRNVQWVDEMVAKEPERSGSARGSHGDPDQGGDLEAYTSD